MILRKINSIFLRFCNNNPFLPFQQKVLKNKYEDLESGSEIDSSEESSEGTDLEQESNPQRKKMRILYNTLLKFENVDSIRIIDMFMEKPSRKDYPDYYEVITNPIDMKIINERIKGGNYKTVDDFISDARLMFNNCRQYNEEGSAIVKVILTKKNYPKLISRNFSTFF